MKLLMTADTVGGVWTYAISLCRALEFCGVQIALATMGKALSSEQKRQASELRNTEVHESCYRLCWMKNSTEDVDAAGKWLLQLEREFNPDVVQLNDLAHGGLPWKSPTVLVVHSCVYSWWQAVKKSCPPVSQWNFYKRLVEASAVNANVIVAPSTPILQKFLAFYCPQVACNNKSLVIANGRDWPPMLDCAPEPLTTSDNATSCVQPFIFTAGRLWDPAKNLTILAKINCAVSWPIYFAGESTDPNGGSDLPSNIHFLGLLPESEMARWLYHASIYVSPALYEPFGLAVLEAARAGCALVLSDIPTFREIWGENAIFVAPNDSDAWVDALAYLIHDQDARDQLGLAALKHSKQYSEQAMAISYFHIFTHLTYHSRCVAGVQS